MKNNLNRGAREVVFKMEMKIIIIKYPYALRSAALHHFTQHDYTCGGAVEIDTSYLLKRKRGTLFPMQHIALVPSFSNPLGKLSVPSNGKAALRALAQQAVLLRSALPRHMHWIPLQR